MSVKIIHTADNHIGMKFNGYPEAIKEALIQERFTALSGIVKTANEKKVDFFVVAGDLFDTVNVKTADIKKTTGILNEFEGQAVVIIPGNHDFYESSSDSIWEKFMKHANESKIQVLHNYQKADYDKGEQKVVFYPCCCRSKHSSENSIGWVKDEVIDPNDLNIGIAHGNVTGLGLDIADEYFNMTPSELKASGLDFWLLGHIHVPYPSSSTTENPGYFMSGTHTPDGWDRKHGGYSWFIEVDENKKTTAQLLETGTLRFYDQQTQINAETDVEKLSYEFNKKDKPHSLMRIELKGRLGKEALDSVRISLPKFKEEFLHFDIRDLLEENIDKSYIDRTYTEDSFPYQLLSALMMEGEESISIQLAHKLIESHRK